MIKYYELAAQLLATYDDVINYGEKTSQLNDLLEVCLQDVNLDQLTSVYRFAGTDDELGYEVEKVGGFITKMKQTYPKPLDIDDFEFDAYGDLYTNTFKRIVDKIQHKEFRSPKGVRVEHNAVYVDDERIATYNSYEQVRPGVLVYVIPQDRVSKIINNHKDLTDLIRSMMIYDRYHIHKMKTSRDMKHLVKDVSFMFKNEDTHLDALDNVLLQVIAGDIEIPNMAVDTTDEKVFSVAINDEPFAILDLTDDDEYLVHYECSEDELENRVNDNKVLTKYVDLVLELMK